MELIETIASFAGYKGLIHPWENPMEELRRRDPNFFREGKPVWTPPAEWTSPLDSLFWHRHGDLMETLGFPPRPQSTLPADCEQLLAEISHLSSTWVNTRHDLLKTCEERQGIINSLVKTCEERLQLIQKLDEALRARQSR